MWTFKYYTFIIAGLLITTCQLSCGGMVRFRDGYSSTDGRVEVKSDDQYSEWGNICSNEFDIIEADVICRQLNYAWALFVYDVEDELGGNDVVLWDLECEGHEHDVYACDHRNTSPADGCEGVSGVGVQCIHIDYENLYAIKKLRLVENVDDYGGLEIYDNYWKPICSSGWDIKDAIVACRQMGFISAVNYTNYMGTMMTNIYTDFDCENEGYLLACEHTKDNCNEFVRLECAGEFEDYLPGESYDNFTDYYPWPYDNPCDDFYCENGMCFIDGYFEAVCDCSPEWEGEHCDEIDNNQGGNGNPPPTDPPSQSSDVDNNQGGNGNPPPTDPTSQSSDDVILYVAIGAGILGLIIAIILAIIVASLMRRKRVQRSKAKAATEIKLKGKQLTENRRNNNSYQQPLGLTKSAAQAQNKPAAPSSEYYMEPSPDYMPRTQPDDYTALTSPSSEIYDEIPYDSVDNGGYMDLKPADYQPPPQLPKPR